MAQYINKSVLVTKIENRIKELQNLCKENEEKLDFIQKTAIHLCIDECKVVLNILNTLEVKEVDNFLTPFISFKDMVNIQYPSVNDGIKAHAETYSFNIESELFNQLTPEQQKLWHKEIEQACISGGDAGVELARDPRYKENLEVKEVKEPASISYVVTRSEEHSDYVEGVFFDEDKAQKYCDRFKGNENEYARHITKVKVTL